jgi:hypothetical protein
MSELSSSDFKDTRAAPSVSREKWALHAHAKLTKGYVLIVSPVRKSANFFMPGKGYDPCPIITAKRLIEQGIVIADGKHPLGDRYRLAPDVDPTLVVSPVVVDDDDDDDVDTGGDDLTDALDTLGSDGEDEDDEVDEAPEEEEED